MLDIEECLLILSQLPQESFERDISVLEISALSILSQLPRVAVEPVPDRPSPLSILSQLPPRCRHCAKLRTSPLLSILSQLPLVAKVTDVAVQPDRTFQFFPSCRQRAVQAGGGVRDPAEVAFNSFPVAAEALAPCLLISLSLAKFEVPESSPALPPNTFVGSRNSFPDSRRKEGR